MFPVTYSKIPPPWTFRSTRIQVSDVQSFRSLSEYRHFSRSSATICCYLLFRKFLRLYFFHKTKKYLHNWKPMSFTVLQAYWIFFWCTLALSLSFRNYVSCIIISSHTVFRYLLWILLTNLLNFRELNIHINRQ